MNTRIEVVLGDITKDWGVEAIVNAANRSLLGGGGVDGAIHRVAGPQLLVECKTLNGCERGEAKVTGAYRLPCKYVVHTVGPVYGGRAEDARILAMCYKESLAAAEERGVRSIAFPSISTGVYGYPVNEAAAVAVRAVREYIEKRPDVFDRILWVLFDAETLSAYQRIIKDQ